MNRSCDVQFTDRIIQSSDSSQYLFDRQFPPFGAEMVGEGTEKALVDANIGRFDVMVPDEIGLVAVLANSDGVGQHSQQTGWSLLIEL